MFYGEEEGFFLVELDEAVSCHPLFDECLYVLVGTLLLQGVVIDKREYGDTRPTDHFDDIVIGGGLDVAYILPQAVFGEDFHFPLEDVLVVEFEELLVCEVYAQLLETVFMEVFEAEYVQDVDRFQVTHRLRLQLYLDLLQDELENRVVYRFAQGVPVPHAALPLVCLVHHLSQHDLLLKHQYFQQTLHTHFEGLGNRLQKLLISNLTGTLLIQLLVLIIKLYVPQL